ncbi:hereditary hemochromatosis protein homolog isoform X2 [Gracilinanus agilis]|uniref:hereditary hemochromatosis protein homolog isoform X2 n=1 Tax=Gracilinanus agilis TaxID=191870 RepID=UPI001CFE7A5F|nr:hereditary hemochromatosis protein homolog isoform X2 [Gracilinanus agilis]XP_044528193.1 hereditary hemochromatosis protein homolog isoform X2 [Gracilinanus agilis]
MGVLGLPWPSAAAQPGLLLLLQLLQPVQLVTAGTSSHHLRYDFTIVSQPSQGQNSYTVLGYFDGQPFVWCCRQGQRAEPRAPWSQVQGPRSWERLIRSLKTMAQRLLINLKSIMETKETEKVWNGEAPGSHTLQAIAMCEFQGNQSNPGFWRYGYDGQELILDLEMLNLTETESKRQVEVRNYLGRANLEQDFLVRTCLHPLRKYLEAGVLTLQKTVPPSVCVTHRGAFSKKSILKCQAISFYPADISLTWLRDGKPMSKGTQESQSIRPQGDGTYQSYVNVEVPSEEESRYACLVEHQGLNGTFTRIWEPPPPKLLPIWIISGCLASALVFVGTTSVFIWRRWKKKRTGFRTKENV